MFIFLHFRPQNIYSVSHRLHCFMLYMVAAVVIILSVRPSVLCPKPFHSLFPPLPVQTACQRHVLFTCVKTIIACKLTETTEHKYTEASLLSRDASLTSLIRTKTQKLSLQYHPDTRSIPTVGCVEISRHTYQLDVAYVQLSH